VPVADRVGDKDAWLKLDEFEHHEDRVYTVEEVNEHDEDFDYERWQPEIDQLPEDQ